MDHADWFVSLDKPIKFQHCNNIIGRGECICSGIIISLQCLPCNKSAFSWHNIFFNKHKRNNSALPQIVAVVHWLPEELCVVSILAMTCLLKNNI